MNFILFDKNRAECFFVTMGSGTHPPLLLLYAYLWGCVLVCVCVLAWVCAWVSLSVCALLHVVA